MCLWHPHIKLTHKPRLWATVVTVQDCLLCLDPIGGTFSVFPANLYVQVWFKAAKPHSLKKSLSENVDFLHTPCPPELPDMELEWLLWEIWRNEGKSAAKTHCALDPRSSQASIMKQVSCGNVSGKNPKFHLCSNLEVQKFVFQMWHLSCGISDVSCQSSNCARNRPGCWKDRCQREEPHGVARHGRNTTAKWN